MMHPFLAPEFHIRWSTLVPEAVEPDIRHALDLAKQNIAAICAQDPATATYESTFLALETASESINDGWSRLNHLDSVSDSPANPRVLDQSEKRGHEKRKNGVRKTGSEKRGQVLQSNIQNHH